MDWAACVGVDWAEKEHTFFGTSKDGAQWPGRFGSSAEDVHEWVREVRARFPTGMIVIAVEQGRGSLLYALMAYEFLMLVPINPRASKAYRDSLRLSGASSDPSDARLICDFAAKHLSELRVWRPDDAMTRKMRLVTEARRRLIDQRTALTHALAAALKEYFPQSLQWFGGESSPSLWTFISRWPTLEQLRSASLADVTSVLRTHRRRKAPEVAQQLMVDLADATPLTSDAAIIEASAMYAQSLIALLIPLARQIDLYDHTIAALWAEHPDRAVFDSLPGAGPVLAPRLAVAFGTDRDRFSTAHELQCYSGIAPVIEASGQQRRVHARYGYPKFLHQTFHEFAQASIPYSAWAKAFYQEQRSRGAKHHEAIRSLAFRWIRILLRLWKTNTPYSEERYIGQLMAKHSPLIARLAA